VTDGSVDDRIQACDDQVVRVEKHKRELEEQLDERLKAAMKNARGLKKLKDANESLDEAITSSGEALEDALETAYKKIAESRDEQTRINACNEARDKMRSQAKVFDDTKEKFEEAEDLLDEGENKQEAHDKAEQCDDLVKQLMDTLENKLNDALASHGDNDDMSDQDLLAVYHAFSCTIDNLMAREELEDPGINREKGMARARLDTIAGVLRGIMEKEEKMRGVLHAALDASLDGQGLP